MKKRRVPIEKILLLLVGAAGVLALIAVSPAAGILIKQFAGKSGYSERSMRRAIARLIGKGHLEEYEGDDGPTLHLTAAGESLIARYQSAEARLRQKPARKWDGVWRIVIFDISEKASKVRDRLRYELEEYGFKRLQHSVWVYPHNCHEYVQLLRAEHRLGKGVMYAEIQHFEYSNDLKRWFKL